VRKLKNGPILGLLRLFRGLRHVPGGHGIVADPQSWPDARARSRRSHLIGHSVVRRRSIGFGRLSLSSSEWSPSDTHPLACHGSRRRHCDRIRVRFGVMRSRPPCCARINRRTQSTTSATRSCTTGPTCRWLAADTKCRTMRGRLSRSSASLEVCVPFNAHWRRSRCPGRPASGRSRFGVLSRPPARATAR
jgi:hypothetical protein